MDTDPGKVLAKAYDIALNGWEIGGGSVRIHRTEVQAKQFKTLGIGDEEAAREVRLPARRALLRRAAARRHRLRLRPHGGDDGGRGPDPRRDRLPEDAARPGPHGRGAEPGHATASLRDLHIRLRSAAGPPHERRTHRPRRRRQVAPGLRRRRDGRAARGGRGRPRDPRGRRHARSMPCARRSSLLEDNPIFNAGTGAVLNFDGFCELDACVMESREARVGAVSGLQRVRNPILVARKVMEETDHVMLTGDGRAALRARHGLPATTTRSRPSGAPTGSTSGNRIDEVLGEQALKMRRFLQGASRVRGRHGRRGGGGCRGRARRGHLDRRRHAQDGGPRRRFARARRGKLRLARAWRRRRPAPASSCCARSPRARSPSAWSTATASPRRCAAVLEQLGRDFDADVGIIAVDRRGLPVAQHRTRDMPHAFFSGEARRGRRACGSRRLATRHKIPVSTLVVIHTPRARGAAHRARRPSRASGRASRAARIPARASRETARARGARGDGHRRGAPRARRLATSRTSTRSIAIWRHRYAPGVTHNTEHVFGLRRARSASR